MPNGLWVRDDIIAGGQVLADLYQACRRDQGWENALSDQQEALDLVGSMMDDLTSAGSYLQDSRLARELEVSLEYEQSLIEVLHDYLTGMFNYYRFREDSDKDQGRARRALAAFDRLRESWWVHTQIVPKLPGAATPYKDAGMLATVDAARRELERFR